MIKILAFLKASFKYEQLNSYFVLLGQLSKRACIMAKCKEKENCSGPAKLYQNCLSGV